MGSCYQHFGLEHATLGTHTDQGGLLNLIDAKEGTFEVAFPVFFCETQCFLGGGFTFPFCFSSRSCLFVDIIHFDRYCFTLRV